MKRRLSFAVTALLAFPFLTTTSACAKPKTKKHATKVAAQSQYPLLGNPKSKYRGWDYLVARLKRDGVKEGDLAAIYQDPRMPRFTFIPFKLKPRESSTIYSTFSKRDFHELGASFIQRHGQEFDQLERKYKVPREVITSILVIETQLGRHTGDELVVHRLSRLASVLDPNNLKENLRRHRLEDPSVTMEDLKARGQYLEDTFLQEIPSIIEISKRNRINVFHIKGSTAGAFGIPQFLPSAFIKYGVDGDGDGQVSLFNEVDALWSAGNYLSTCGYRPDLSYEERRKVIWQYNKSDAYIDAVFQMSEGIRALLT